MATGVLNAGTDIEKVSELEGRLGWGGRLVEWLIDGCDWMPSCVCVGPVCCVGQKHPILLHGTDTLHGAEHPRRSGL